METDVRARVVVIGSGTPLADPSRRGPAIAVVIDDRVLLFDAGPGVLRGIAEDGESY